MSLVEEMALYILPLPSVERSVHTSETLAWQCGIKYFWE